MKTQIITSTFLLSFALAACGDSVGGDGAPIGGKGDAAQAAYRTQQTGEDLESRQSQGLVVAQNIPDINNGNISATEEWTVDGAEGTAKVTMRTDITGGDVEAQYTVEYSSYSSDGVDFIDGTVEYITSVSTGVDVSVQNTVRGNAIIWGTQAADLDMDATLSVDVSGTTGSVAIVMDGTVVADGETYSYDGETFDVVADTF